MHIVFYIAPFTGHINTSLPLVTELAGRGHRVSYATTAKFSQVVRGAGARVVSCDAAWPPADAQPAVPVPVPAENAADIDFARNLGVQLRELSAALPVLIPAFADDPPDVVVCDPMCWAGRALAGRYQVPAVNCVTTLIGRARWSLGSASSSFDPAQRHLPRLFAAASAILASHETRLTAAHLLGTDGAIETLAYFPRALEAEGDEFGPNIHFVGPCLPATRGGQPESQGPGWRPAGDGPVIAVSLGTVFNREPAVFRSCLDALAGLRCQVVAALGGLDPASLGPLPPNAEAHTYLPLPQLLRHADLLIGHAGMRSTMEALSVGVPIAALPQMPEQRVTADRLAELGLGLCLETVRQTPEGVRSAVTGLLADTGVRERLAWMRDEIEQAPGAAGAADVVENARVATPASPSGRSA
jgi:demethyllactenocin mycarosyltransferase